MKNATGPIQLLLIEDDELSRGLLTLQMTACGYIVATAESGDAALTYLNKIRGTMPTLLPDAILTDLHMPGVSGVALAHRLRASVGDGEPPILLAMSASDPESELSPAYDGFLLKPFTMEHLTAQIAAQWLNSAAVSSSPLTDASDVTPVPSLDEKVYQQLAHSMSATQLQQLYKMCLDDTLARITRMQAAAATGDATLYSQEAHAIKGSSGMVGAFELQHLASSAEVQNFATANHIATHNDLLAACSRLQRILVEHEN